jgi:hypothetical protein
MGMFLHPIVKNPKKIEKNIGNGRRKGTAVQLGTTSSFQIPFRPIFHEPIGFCLKKNGRTFRISKNKLVHKTPNFSTNFENTISQVY